MGVPKKYVAPELQDKSSQGHTKVECTWDEAPQSRKRDLMKKKFSADQLRDADLQAYLASSDEEDGDAEENAAALRSLVLGDDEAGSDGPMPGEGFSSDDGEGEVFGDMEATFNTETDKLEEDLQEKMKQQGGNVHTLDTTEEKKKGSLWQQYLDKKKAKKKERKAQAKAERDARKDNPDNLKPPEELAHAQESSAKELELLAMGADEEDRGFNFRSKLRGHGGHAMAKKKNTVGENDTFEMNVDDPRIAKVFGNSDFDIDPTNPEFKATDGMKTILSEKRKKKLQRGSGKAAGAATKSLVEQAAADAAQTVSAAAPVKVDQSSGFSLFGGARKRAAPAESTAGPAGAKKNKSGPKLM